MGLNGSVAKSYSSHNRTRKKRRLEKYSGEVRGLIFFMRPTLTTHRFLWKFTKKANKSQKRADVNFHVQIKSGRNLLLIVGLTKNRKLDHKIIKQLTIWMQIFARQAILYIYLAQTHEEGNCSPNVGYLLIAALNTEASYSKRNVWGRIWRKSVPVTFPNSINFVKNR